MDWCWTRRIIQSPIMKCRNEIDQSSSSWKSLSRKWWSDWISGRIKDNLQKHFLYCHHWSDDQWKTSMARGGGRKNRYQYCSDSSGAIWYFRALQGHSARSLIDHISQDNVIIPSGFFQNIYHVGCAINLHSIINSGLIFGGQNLNNRQTVFFLFVDPMDKNLKDLDTIDLNEPRHAQYMHKAWKKHQNTVYWVDINFAQKKGLKFYRTRSNAIIFFTKHSSLLYSVSCSDWSWRSHIRRKYMRHFVFFQRSLWNMIGWKNWVQKLLNDHMEKLRNNAKVHNQANQIQTQIMIERRNPLFAVTQVTCNVTSNQC